MPNLAPPLTIADYERLVSVSEVCRITAASAATATAARPCRPRPGMLAQHPAELLLPPTRHLIHVPPAATGTHLIPRLDTRKETHVLTRDVRPMLHSKGSNIAPCIHYPRSPLSAKDSRMTFVWPRALARRNNPRIIPCTRRGCRYKWAMDPTKGAINRL